MKYSFIFLAFLFFGFHKVIQEHRISDENRNASTPRFCTDNKGNPVMSWVEKEGDKPYFYYAISQDNGKTFGEKTLIPTVRNLSVHAEGMPKIAIKNDGTLVALFEQKRVSETSRFGSTLYYTMSSDFGKNWITPNYLPFDTTGTSHSFSDITTLKNGEVAATWLDEKITPTSKGRTVKYATTSKGKGFSEAIIVEKDACECCRTNVFEDSKGNIHISFRDQSPEGFRDISHVVSTNGGKTFSESSTFSPDNWKVNACPHTGPSTTETQGKVQVAWFTGKENEEKIELYDLTANKMLFSLKSQDIKHPQVASLGNKTILAYEEIFHRKEVFFKKICLKIIDQNGKISTKYITEDYDDASYPVLMASDKNLIIAYEIRKGDEKMQVKYQVLEEKFVK